MPWVAPCSNHLQGCRNKAGRNPNGECSECWHRRQCRERNMAAIEAQRLVEGWTSRGYPPGRARKYE